MIISAEQFREACDRLWAEELVHPCFALGLGEHRMLEPYKRTVHWREWPAPIWANDNTERYR